jgi:hypothetical protein
MIRARIEDMRGAPIRLFWEERTGDESSRNARVGAVR